MRIGVLASGTTEFDVIETAQSELARIEVGMLPGENKLRRQPARGQGVGNWREFDGFRSCSDDERDTIATQPSP